MFNDRSTMKANFFTADIFDSESSCAKTLRSKVDVQVSGDFLHLVDWNGQINAACAMVALSRPQPGSIIIGKQIGLAKGRPVGTGWGNKDTMSFHNDRTFESMWKEIEKRT